MKYGLGFIPSEPDSRDYLLKLAPLTEPLPLKYSAYDDTLYPVYNQGRSSLCATYASAALKTWEERGDEKRIDIFDAKWLYVKCKKIDGHPLESGTTLRAAMQVLKAEGMPLARTFGRNANKHKIAAYYKVPFDVHNLKLAIQQYGPIIVGQVWFESWMSPEDGVLPIPEKVAGGHATIYYGWDDTIKTSAGLGGLLGQNSWGLKWGKAGSYVLPYPYTMYFVEAFKAVDVLGDDLDEPTNANTTNTGTS